MFGTKFHIPASAAGKTVELSTKHGKKETDNHIVMWIGTKTDKASGEMKGQIRGVRNDTVYKQILNALKGRHIATSEEIAMHCMSQGMTQEQAAQALDHVTMPHGNSYSVASLKKQVNEFQMQQAEERKTQGKFSAKDGKLLSEEFQGKRSPDLLQALQRPIENYKD